MQKVSTETSKKGSISALRSPEASKSGEQNEQKTIDLKSDAIGSKSGAEEVNKQSVPIDVFLWSMYNLTLPIILILIFPLLCCIYPRIRQAYKPLLGDGVLLVFSGLLLLGVQGLLQQTRFTVTHHDLNKGLCHRAVILLILGIATLLTYCFNFIFNTLDKFKVLPRKDFAGAETTWILLGAVATLVAVVFSLYAICYNNKSLLLLRQRRGL